MFYKEYILTIEAFNQKRPEMNDVRAYNHQMIDILDTLRPIQNKKLLDVGASPHGYAMEQALLKGVSAYIGIGLGIAEDIEVKHQNACGKLINMNAETLNFESEMFDLIISLSTFEHFFDGSQVLREMYHVLKPGGSVLINFQPVWTSSYGHHLHHIEEITKLIPPWAHLIWTEETMQRALEKQWTSDMSMSLKEAIEWIYKSLEINRVDVVKLHNMFINCQFEIEWMTPLYDEQCTNKLLIADYLSKILPYSVEELMTLGYSLLLNKR